MNCNRLVNAALKGNAKFILVLLHANLQVIVIPMKKAFILLSILLVIYSMQSFAQQGQVGTATTHTKASIVVPISIANINDLNFGNIAVSASMGGTVTINGSNQRIPTGGVSLPASVGTVQAATFEVTGAPNYLYTITVPTQINVFNGSNFMLVNSFASTPPNGNLDNSGKQTIKIGATLNVDPNQPDGDYQSTGQGFTVTVQYN
jgi:hypothetical protein